MSLPRFTKVGLTDLVFSKGYLFPIHDRLQFHQLKSIAQGGPMRVATLRDPTRYFPLHFERMPMADYAGLRAWLLNPNINGAAFPFTFVDMDATAHTVRWWEDSNFFDMPMQPYGLYTFDIALIVDDFA